MKYAVAIHGAPYSSQAAEHALDFMEALFASGHTVERVFFFHEGAYHGLNGRVAPQTERRTDPRPRGAALESRGGELGICISSGIKRGVIDASEQQRYELPSLTLANDFQLVGLGQLIAAIEASDRYIEFPA